MVSFKLFAGTNVGLRENNEDNFTVCPDLTKNEWIVPADCQQTIQLGDRGSLMVIADGMGGQNAGEVASAIAIDTVQELFSIKNMSADVLEKADNIKDFLKQAIIEADVRIKKRTKEDPATSGMGSTIVISWLVNEKVYVAWLGDSRAYSYISQMGIGRLSKDHSYVQQLVDAGTLTDVEAMNHPNSNIITRSLGDTSQKAKPDVAEYDITNGEIILLCSDGLCGVCRDEEIGGIIEENKEDLTLCKDKLTTAALAAGGSDNITISLMQILIDESNKTQKKEDSSEGASKGNGRLVKSIASIFFISLLGALSYAGYSLFKKQKMPEYTVSFTLNKDSLKLHESTQFAIAINGEDTTYQLLYDSSLFKLDSKKKSIKALRAFSVDSTSLIKVVCNGDTSTQVIKKIRIKAYNNVETITDMSSSSLQNFKDAVHQTENRKPESKPGQKPEQVLQESHGDGQNTTTSSN